MAIEEIGRCAARRRRRRRALWYRLRRLRRGLFAVQRCQLDREHREGTRSRRRLGEEEPVNNFGTQNADCGMYLGGFRTIFRRQQRGALHYESLPSAKSAVLLAKSLELRLCFRFHFSSHE